MRDNGRIGLTKEQIRRIVLLKLKIVYRDWRSKESPFSSAKKSGSRRSDPRAFETALVASLLGGLSEAIEQNNQALATAFRRPGASAGGRARATRRIG
jgi:hypothetical protein